jgi:hypothetical protein
VNDVEQTAASGDARCMVARVRPEANAVRGNARQGSSGVQGKREGVSGGAYPTAVSVSPEPRRAFCREATARTPFGLLVRTLYVKALQK